MFCFRVGDLLLTINNQLLSGRPISDVKASIRTIPKGLVQFILKTPETESECTPPLKSIQKDSAHFKSHEDTVSISSEEHSQQSSSSSLVLPPDNSKDFIPVPAAFSKSHLSLHDDVDSISAFVHESRNIPDDMSDFLSLPPAPPRPIISQNVYNSLQNLSPTNRNMRNDVASFPPPQPRSFTPGKSIHQFEQVQCNTDDSDSDLGSTFSCIPAPPPPVDVSKKIQRSHKSNKRKHLKRSPGECENDNEFDESFENDIEEEEVKDMGYVETTVASNIDVERLSKDGSQSNGFHEHVTTNSDEEELKRQSVLDYLENNIQNEENTYEDISVCRNNDNNEKTNVEDGTEFTPPLFDIAQILESPRSSVQRTSSFNSRESLSVFPEGIVVYHENHTKKKTLFSKLKSKILLPSKGDAKEYTSPSKECKSNTTEHVKHSKDKKHKQTHTSSPMEFHDTPHQSPKFPKDKKKKKQRPASSLDFSDQSIRNTIKASISQPDLTSMSSCQVDLMFRKDGPDSPVITSRGDSSTEPTTRNSDISGSKNRSHSSNASPRSIRSHLPRILSARRSSKELTGSHLNSSQKKNRKRANSFATNVSPPRTPPPPPPPYEFTHSDEVDADNGNIGYPGKVLAEYNIPLCEQHAITKSMSESSSSIPGSYAAFGPTVTSANVSMDNLNVTYDVICGKEQLNMTHELSGVDKQLNTTYNLCDNDQSHLSKSSDGYDETYETLDNITKKPTPLPKPKHLEFSRDSSECVTGGLISTNICEQGSDPQVHTLPSEKECILELNNKNKELRKPLTTATSNNLAQTSLHKRQPSGLTEKDKLDPKLQPFIMTQGVSALLRTWPSEPSKFKTSSSPYSDYDDDGWGSEFSSNVLEYSTTPDSLNRSLTQARKLSLLNNLDNSADPEQSLENLPPGSENSFNGKVVSTDPPPGMPKPKGRDFRNFFSRGNKAEHFNVDGEKRFGKKEKRKLVKSAALPENKNIEIPCTREDEDEANQTHNGDKGTGRFANKNITQKQMEGDDKSSTNKRNPIPKPPRRRSADIVLLSTNYSCDNAVLEDYNKSINDSPTHFRPVPPIPDFDEDSTRNIIPLSQEQHNELYASIDYSTKANTRITFDNNVEKDDDEKPSSAGNLNNIGEGNGYISDSTVYSEPERNNSPAYSPERMPLSGSYRVNKTQSDYATIESITERHEEVSNPSAGQSNSQIEDKRFAVEVFYLQLASAVTKHPTDQKFVRYWECPL